MKVANSPANMMDHISRTFSNLESISNPFLFLGYDLQDIGGKCSIVVCFIVFIYTLYAVISWVIRLMLFKDSSIKLCALLCRASFPDFFLITKASNQGKV